MRVDVLPSAVGFLRWVHKVVSTVVNIEHSSRTILLRNETYKRQVWRIIRSDGIPDTQTTSTYSSTTGKY